MELFKRISLRLLFPPLGVVLVSVPLAAVLLFYVFFSGQEERPVAYVTYVLSAYALTILCARLVRMPKPDVRARLHQNPLAHRYLTDVHVQMRVSLYLSLGLYLLYAAMKLFYGLWYRSVWFGTLAVYYILLAVMRFLLLRHAHRNVFGAELRAELRQYRLCGIILVLMTITLAGVVILVVQENEGFQYAGYLIYVMAMYAFYNIISAVRDVIRYRQYQSPVMSAAKAIKLAAALVSMLSLETAMLAQFGNGQDPGFRQLMTGLTGGGACLIVLGMGIYMIAGATRRLHTLEEDG